MPKGTLRGSPANPADDVTTLRTSFYLVAQKKLDSDLITDLTESLMNARRDLLAEFPLLAQVTAPDTDASAYMPVHPGAAAFYNGTQESFPRQMGQHHLPGADDRRRARLGIGCRLEVPARRRRR